MEAILVALITGGLSLLGVVITNMMAARRAEQRMVTAQAVTDARLEELTREVRAHNNFAQRVPVLEEQLRQLQQFLPLLDERELLIIEKRFGLHGRREQTQKEIAQELGISRSYVSRIEKRAFLKLYRAFRRQQKQGRSG